MPSVTTYTKSKIDQLMADSGVVQDTAANLAAENEVYAAGVLVEAVDVSVFSIGDGVTAYNSLPKYRSLPDVERLSSTVRQTGINATPTVLTGLSNLTFTVSDVPMKVRGFVSHVEAITNPVTAQLQIVDDAGTPNLKGYGAVYIINGHFGSVLAEEDVISTPGTYVRTLRMQRGLGTGTINTLLNTAGVYAYIEAVPAPQS
jgi:hypothetical protein